ncbi:phage repressor protein [Acetobacter sp. DsW_063]|nr:phage repressor protein [Acetobacter sp. DsW_063]
MDQCHEFPVRDDSRELTNVAERLREAVSKAGGNRAVSEQSGIPISTLNTYIAGRDMKGLAAARLARTCGVSLEWLYFGPDAASPPQLARTLPAKTAQNLISIPQFDVQVSAGHGTLAPNVESSASIEIGRHSLPSSVLARLNHLTAVTVRGDSMSPSLYDGDTILIDTGDCEVIAGSVYVLRRDTDIMVKRLSWSVTGDLIVSSDNPAYERETISASRARQLFEDGGHPIVVVGRVVFRIGIMGAR